MKKSITNINISIIMGSQSDWKTLVNTEETLEHESMSTPGSIRMSSPNVMMLRQKPQRINDSII